MYPTFIDTLRSEALKTKGSWGLSISLLGPLAVSTVVLTYFLLEPARVKDATNNLWFTLGRFHFNFFFLLYPLFTALIAFLIANIEHQSKGFKQLFVLPVPKFYFYLSKWIILLGWLSASLLFAAGLLYGMGYLLEWIFPSSPFDQFAPGTAMLVFLGDLAIALLALLAIHYFLSIYFDNFIISVGSACFLFILGLVAANWEYGYLIPYSYFPGIFISYISEGETNSFNQREVWICAGYAVTFFTLGYFMFSSKQVKN